MNLTTASMGLEKDQARTKKVSDGIGTQVRTQTINKCRIKMILGELYDRRDPPYPGDRKGEREDGNNLNCSCIQL